MKKHVLVLSLLAAIAVPASAEGVYIFGDVGQSKFSGGISETDTAFAVGLGYNINTTFDVELGYHELGGVSESGSIYIEGDEYDYSGSFDATAIQLSATAKLPLSDSFNIYGRLGYAKITGDTKVSVLDIDESTSDSENKATLGVGASYKMSEKVSLRADYIKFNDVDISSLTIGLTYAF